MSQGYIPNDPKPYQPQQRPPQPVPQQYRQPMQPATPQPQGVTQCQRCGGNNVHISVTQAAASTNSSGRGCLWTLGRRALIVLTMGLWLIIGKSKGKAKTVFHSQKVAVCQTCGNSWTVK